MNGGEPTIAREIRPCRLCAADFAATATRHEPRPVVWLRQRTRILIVGQAPGLRVHESGIPFDDRSGDRLREWLGVARDEFYDRDRISILPMAFCFPGYDVNGSDLPPPPRCAATWRSRALDALNQVRLTILIGCRVALKSETRRFRHRVLPLVARFGCHGDFASRAPLRDVIDRG